MRTAIGGLVGSPLRNLAAVVSFMAALIVLGTVGYVAQGWSLLDAFYMVILTVYTIGFEEVRPIDTPALHLLTITVIVFGCTGMIVFTGALVQLFTFGEIRQLMGLDRMDGKIGKLKDHVIICGFGRIGQMLAKELQDGGATVLVIDRSDARVAQARALGHLALQVDAADEAGLKTAGVERARVLATVLPDDAANVFITLSARSLNAALTIIARGEQPSTESKLIYAGADKVVLPTHIGAERIAEMILFPETNRFIRGSERMRDFDKTLRDLGLRLEVVTVPAGSAVIDASVAEVERQGRGLFFVIQLDRKDGETVTRPPGETKLMAGDGVLVVSRAETAALTAVFQGRAGPMRAGRSVF